MTHFLSLVFAAWFFVFMGAIGTKNQWWSYTTGFILLACAIVIAFWVLSQIIFNFSRSGVLHAYPAFILSIIPLIWVAYYIYLGLTSPILCDVTTDPEKPVVLRLAQIQRTPQDHPTDYPKDRNKPLQQQYWPDIKPLVTLAKPQAVFEHALDLVKKKGWFYQADPALLEIHAVSQTALFGFSDDISIRIQSTNTGSRLDIRSASRVGKSDLGMNAKRIRIFLNELKMRLS